MDKWQSRVQSGTARAHTQRPTSPCVGRKGYPPNRYPISVNRATQRDTAQTWARHKMHSFHCRIVLNDLYI